MTAPRRIRHYFARSVYGGVLFVLMWTAYQRIVGFQQVESAGDIARFGSLLFRILLVLQLSFALFFAPIVAGSSISAEKDRRTFVLLLMTDLTNWEIVMGKLLSSLLQMGVLLTSALPIFAICLLLGGASPEQVGRVFAVTAATALAGGALGIVIASWREKTFQTLALTVLVVVLYLVMVEVVRSWVGEDQPLGLSGEDWRAALNPVFSIFAVLNPPQTSPPPWLPLGKVEWAFVSLMVAVTLLLVGVSIATLRVWNPGGGKPTFARERIEEMEKRLAAEAKSQPKAEPRPIWDNPVLWREMRTRAYGRGPILIKAGYVVFFALMFAYFHFRPPEEAQPGRLTIAKAVVPIIVVSLILVNAQAVTAITSERDGRALDLLLVTDVTPKEFIFGKIWGVFYNTKEMIALPLGLCAFLWGAGHVGWEVWLYLMLGLAILVTFSTTLGLHMSLAYEKTRAAVANSLGTIFFLFVGILLCIYLILHGGRFETQFASFVVFIFAGSVAMYVSLSVRNQSAALALASSVCPFLTWWAIAHLLPPGSSPVGGDPLGGFLAFAVSYGFATLAMLVPAVSEFDVALGRTVADE